MLGHDRRVFAAGRRLEAIPEPSAHRLRGRLIKIDVDPPAPGDEQAAQIVDAVGGVGVLVGEQHRVEPVHLGIEQLLAQVGRGIDQDPGDACAVAPFYQQRGASAPVPGIARIADAPAQCRARNAAGGPEPRMVTLAVMGARTQTGAECLSSSTAAACGGTLRNRRKKLSLVWRAMVSSDTPRASASTLAVSTT